MMSYLNTHYSSKMPDSVTPPENYPPGLTTAYVRVSKVDQDTEHQIRRYMAQGIPADLIFIDQGTSGGKHPMKRTQFRRLYDLVEKGLVATIYVSELTRLGRDTLSTLEVLINLWTRDVTVHALNEYDEKVLSADLIYRPILISALSLSGDIERRHNQERTRIALETARLRGVHIGRKKIKVDRKKLEGDMKKYGISMTMAAKINGIKPSTLTRAKKEWREEDATIAGTPQPSPGEHPA